MTRTPGEADADDCEAEVERLREVVRRNQYRKERDKLKAEVERLRDLLSKDPDVDWQEMAKMLDEKEAEVERLRETLDICAEEKAALRNNLTLEREERMASDQEVERLRAALAQETRDKFKHIAEVERLREEKAEMAAQWYQRENVDITALKAEVERLREGIKEALAYTQQAVVADLLSAALGEEA